jgi:hypothetical protein
MKLDQNHVRDIVPFSIDDKAMSQDILNKCKFTIILIDEENELGCCFSWVWRLFSRCYMLSHECQFLSRRQHHLVQTKRSKKFLSNFFFRLLSFPFKRQVYFVRKLPMYCRRSNDDFQSPAILENLCIKIRSVNQQQLKHELESSCIF